jgi:methionyl-tRNA formyltransferase
MKIIFMGTPDFAVPSLQKLITAHDVACVFTAAPKPKGRGMRITKSPVHLLSETNNIPVYTPTSLKSHEVQIQIDSINADIIVVVAYGFIVPKKIIESKGYGALNIHPSKLPRFRGAAPLQRTIIEGDLDTAVCIMQMDEGLDTGDIILQEDFTIPKDITLQELHDICANKGADLLIQALDNIGTLKRTPQKTEGVSYAHKLTKEEGLIDWHLSATELERKVRGMTPWPGVFFEYKDMMVKILNAQVHNTHYTLKPGTIIPEDSLIVCDEGALRIEFVQKPGKGPISFEELLRD